jgi:hypothetical protein
VYAIVEATLQLEERVERYQLTFSVHAGLRMSKWSIDEEDVQTVVDTGDVIEEYLNALPLPCQLMTGGKSRCNVCFADKGKPSQERPP